VDIRRDLYNGVVFTGGTSLITGACALALPLPLDTHGWQGSGPSAAARPRPPALHAIVARPTACALGCQLPCAWQGRVPGAGMWVGQVPPSLEEACRQL
jgi:hypothetical protein